MPVCQWLERLGIDPGNRSIKEEYRVQVLVRDNNVDQALKVLKKKMQREGVFREMKLHGHYEKPSERRIREKSEAICRARKLARKKLQREGLLPMKPRVVAGTMGQTARRVPPASDIEQASVLNLMASEIKVTPQNVEMLEEEDPGIPPLDLSDAAVESLLHSAQMRGYVTNDQISLSRSSEGAKSEQIEDILAKFDEMGGRLVEADAKIEVEVPTDEELEEEAGRENELVERRQTSPLVKSGKKDPVERTDDPVRMYLRDMSSVELLSRAGEVAIAKRIEAGRGVMLAGLCDSPLTFAAFAIWRDALNEGKIYLRDIVDLEETHADPEAKAMRRRRLVPIVH